jgi:hypothetical protein
MILYSFLLQQDMIQNFDQVARLVLNSLDDMDPRVLWATMLAIVSLSEYKEQLLHAEYHKKLLTKLVPIIRWNSCARVQVQTYKCYSLTSVIKELLVFFVSIYVSIYFWTPHHSRNEGNF